MNKYGLRLKELREQKGITQETLADMLHTSRSRIGMYEQGKRQPDFEMQEAIADYFNVSIDYLFGRDDFSVLVETIPSSPAKERYMRILEAYAKATPEIQKAVELILKANQPDS